MACPEDDHGFDPAAVWQHPDHGNKRIALSGAAGTGVGLLCFFCKDLSGVLQGAVQTGPEQYDDLHDDRTCYAGTA